VPDASRIRAWFDTSETTLTAEAERAGLLEHGASVGAVREFLIHRVLRTLLPSAVDVCSGRAVSASGDMSRQLDVIVYDSRFPRFEAQRGLGLYPLEGIIATIEIKSTLTKPKLSEALENCRSVLALNPWLQDAEPWRARARALAERGFSLPEGRRRAGYEFIPSTYIFSFQSRLKRLALSRGVNAWFEQSGYPRLAANRCLAVPRVIVAGTTVGILGDNLISIDPRQPVEADPAMDPPSDVLNILGFWDVSRRFGWLASHLMHTSASRLGLVHAASGARYGFQQYLPIDEYFQEDIAGKTGSYLVY